MDPMIFAHQGGWDEILFALTPLVIVAALLWLANRRAKAAQRHNTAQQPDASDDPLTP